MEFELHEVGLSFERIKYKYFFLFYNKITEYNMDKRNQCFRIKLFYIKIFHSYTISKQFRVIYIGFFLTLFHFGNHIRFLSIPLRPIDIRPHYRIRLRIVFHSEYGDGRPDSFPYVAIGGGRELVFSAVLCRNKKYRKM